MAGKLGAIYIFYDFPRAFRNENKQEYPKGYVLLNFFLLSFHWLSRLSRDISGLQPVIPRERQKSSFET